MTKKVTTTSAPEDLDARIASAEAELTRLNAAWPRFGPMASRAGEHWVTFDPTRMLEKLAAGLAVDAAIITLEALKAERARRALDAVTEPGHRAGLEAAVETQRERAELERLQHFAAAKTALNAA